MTLRLNVAAATTYPTVVSSKAGKFTAIDEPHQERENGKGVTQGTLQRVELSRPPAPPPASVQGFRSRKPTLT